jgi:large subunit ribosomal protein L18
MIKGTFEKPRLCVFRSHRVIYAQIINDQTGQTLASANSLKLKAKNSKVKQAFTVGEFLAQNALKKKIKKVVFDRGRYRYHGRVRALAEGARKGGLIF